MNETTNQKILEQGLPADVEAERILLGSLLVHSVELDDLNLRAGQFHLPRHRLIYAAMVELQLDGQPIEGPSVVGLLEDDQHLEAVGGWTYLSSLGDMASSGSLPYYADRIRSKWIQRRAMAVGESITAHALEADDGDDAVEYAESLMSELAEDSQEGIATQEAVHVREAANDYTEQLETRDARSGLKTGLRDLDRVIVCLEPKTLTIVGARPSNGKTALALTMARNLATAVSPVASGICSLEMSRAQLAERLIAMVGLIDLQDLRHGSTERSFWSPVVEAQQKLNTLPIYIDDTRALTANQVCSRIRRMKQRYDIGIAFIDFVTRLKFPEKHDYRHQVGDAAKAFKDLSGELNMPIIALSQLSRSSVSDGKVRKPQLSDLRESGNLEEDADTVIFVHREEMYYPNEANRGRAELIVAKQRQGPAPETVEVAFLGKHVMFENLAWRS